MQKTSANSGVVHIGNNVSGLIILPDIEDIVIAEHHVILAGDIRRPVQINRQNVVGNEPKDVRASVQQRTVEQEILAAVRRPDAPYLVRKRRTARPGAGVQICHKRAHLVFAQRGIFRSVPLICLNQDEVAASGHCIERDVIAAERTIECEVTRAVVRNRFIRRVRLFATMSSDEFKIGKKIPLLVMRRGIKYDIQKLGSQLFNNIA